MHTLEQYGWNANRLAQWQALTETSGLQAGRVIADYGSLYTVATPDPISAQLSGTLMHTLQSMEMPKIGDWVALKLHDDTPATIHHIFERTSEVVRGQAGRLLDKQVVAANVDVAFVVQPLDHDFSAARLERYIFQLKNQHIRTVILLNKSDTAKDISMRLEQLEDLDADVLVMSALKDTDLSPIERYIVAGETIVILGSSGAGKSTLTNRLLGEQRQRTQAIRERDSKGRHTTVHRELFVLPGGGMIIDTPGIRELQLWGDEADLETLFPEIYATALRCRYNNCVHDSEDGCAIKAGIADGSLDQRRYRVYLNFKQELATLDARRGFIAERRTQQSRASAKRRLNHARRSEQDQDDPTDYPNTSY